jgi:hypothetical protein
MRGMMMLFGALQLLASCGAQGRTEDTTASAEQVATGSAHELFNRSGTGFTVIYQDRSGAHWFAGADTGVFRYDGQQLELFTSNRWPLRHADPEHPGGRRGIPLLRYTRWCVPL